MDDQATEEIGPFKLLGFILFAFSFIPPGFTAFCRTPEFAFSYLSDGIKDEQWHWVFLAIILAIGWLANFTVLFRLPNIAARVAMAAPWAIYFGMMFLSYNPGVQTDWPDTSITMFFSFYPWAIGIGLIHLGRIMEPAPKQYPRTSWTGF